MRKIVTLCIVHQHPKILLGMKKKGFGAGRWNGFGGKVKDGETIEEAAIREMKEESGIEIINPEKIGVIDFDFEGKPIELEMHIYKVKEYSGDIIESEEMLPQWFFIDEIPFSDMWQADRYWLPFFLKDRKFRGRILFDADDNLLNKDINEVNQLS